MKKIILLVVVTLSFLSCSKNEDGDSSEKQLTRNYQNMSGKWYYASIIRPNGSTDPYVHFCTTQKDYSNITPVGIIKAYHYDAGCVSEINTCDSYYFDGNTIRLCFEDFSGGRVTSLTATTMKVEFDDARSFGSISGPGAKGIILTK